VPSKLELTRYPLQWLFPVLILVIWLYGILLLPERRAGYIIGLLGSLMASFIAFGHLTGIAGDVFIGEIAEATGAFFVAGLVILAGIDPERGRRAAEAG